jgi:hypothetical protein
MRQMRPWSKGVSKLRSLMFGNQIVRQKAFVLNDSAIEIHHIQGSSGPEYDETGRNLSSVDVQNSSPSIALEPVICPFFSASKTRFTRFPAGSGMNALPWYSLGKRSPR